MREEEVAKRVGEYLKEAYELVSNEFAFSGGRVDLIGFRWEKGDDPHYIHALGVECKGEIKYAKQVYGLLTDQLARYLKTIPQLYLATPRPKGENATNVLSEIKMLCRLNHIGYLYVDHDVEPDPPIDDRTAMHTMHMIRVTSTRT